MRGHGEVATTSVKLFEHVDEARQPNSKKIWIFVAVNASSQRKNRPRGDMDLTRNAVDKMLYHDEIDHRKGAINMCNMSAACLVEQKVGEVEV